MRSERLHPTDSQAGQPTEGSRSAEGWKRHEHVAPSVQNQAQKLIDEAGSPGLAKEAVNAAAQQNAERAPSASANSSKDQFARNHGFKSYLELFEASTTMSQSAGKNWFVTALPGGKWIMWNDRDLRADQTFNTFEEACAEVPPKGTSAPA